MQRLPLRRQPSQNLRHFPGIHKRARVQALQLHLPIIDILQPLARRRRDGLETPFLEGDAPEEGVAVDGDFFLPPFFRFLPGGPGGGGFVDDALADGGFGAWDGGRVRDAFAVDERAARGDGEEEEAHDDEE